MTEIPETPEALNERWALLRYAIDRANRLAYASNNLADRGWVGEIVEALDAEETRVREMEEILVAHGLEVPGIPEPVT